LNAARRFRAALVATFGLWVAVFFWMGSQSDPFWRGYDFTGKNDYYNILVDGFLGGHLAMNAGVHPDLLSADPLVRSRAPYLLDAALFKGRYYLYYGVTPAATLLYPYALLTGRHLSLQWACLLYVVAGLGVGVLWLARLRGRPGADWRPGFAFCAVTLLAMAPGTMFLVRRSSFYDLPVAAGYMWMSLVWFALWQALAGKSAMGWILLAGASFGLAVGCRADLLLLGPAIAACPWVVGRRTGRRLATWVGFLVPVAVIGAGLAWYNYARFGNPVDFGFSHGLNSFFSTGNPLLSLRFLLSNARAYLFAPPSFGSWFPFVFPLDSGPIPGGYSNAESMVGFLPLTLLAAWIAAACGVAGRKRSVGEGDSRLWVKLLMAAAAIEALFAFLLGIRAYRYAVDFLTPVSLLLVTGFAVSWEAAGWSGRIARTGAVVLGLLASLHVAFGSVQLFYQFKYSRPAEFAALSSLLNPQQATLERMGAPRPGGVALKIRFLQPKSADTASILATGLPDAFDSLRATVFPNGYVQFSIFHGGFGGPRTGLIPIVWGRAYTLEASMGSLYPRADDRFFQGRANDALRGLKTLGWLRFDGKTLIDRRMAFFESSPWPRVTDGLGNAGRLVAVDSVTLGIAAPGMLTDPRRGPAAIYSLELALPGPRTTRPFPLLCSGVSGNGDLLFFDPLPDGRYRLGVDEWGFGALFGNPFTPRVGKLTHVDIVAGPALGLDPRLISLPGMARADDLRDRIIVWYGGELIGNLALTHHLDTFDTLHVGLNEAGFSSAVETFVGELHQLKPSDAEQEQILERAGEVPR
jgi:hypothetical protein